MSDQWDLSFGAGGGGGSFGADDTFIDDGPFDAGEYDYFDQPPERGFWQGIGDAARGIGSDKEKLREMQAGLAGLKGVTGGGAAAAQPQQHAPSAAGLLNKGQAPMDLLQQVQQLRQRAQQLAQLRQGMPAGAGAGVGGGGGMMGGLLGRG